MAFKFFISEEFLKENTNISANVDMTYLRPTMRLCQEKYILPLLGTALYNYFINTATFGSDYTNLMDNYVQPTLLWYIVSEATIPLTIKFTNKGMIMNSGDNEQPVTPDQMYTYMEKARQDAEYYAEKMIKFLCANSALFTEYTNPGTTSDTVIPRKTVFDSPVFVSGSRNQGTALSSKDDTIQTYSERAHDWW